MGKLICKQCNERMHSNGATCSTLVGYMSEPGHDHDDNCKTRYYQCKNGHGVNISKVNTCYNDDCDWTGKTECFCHTEPKVVEWPE